MLPSPAAQPGRESSSAGNQLEVGQRLLSQARLSYPPFKVHLCASSASRHQSANRPVRPGTWPFLAVLMETRLQVREFKAPMLRWGESVRRPPPKAFLSQASSELLTWTLWSGVVCFGASPGRSGAPGRSSQSHHNFILVTERESDVEAVGAAGVG